ncbi:MAG TPA: DUF1569 domain-containing protein [Planctomycetes bacterium]|nr:DUF1569 domain-containing protein [Planctomycetota bacterium]HIL37832.1 DUF1569 domain-containing protein [Planctomycetota bacterium]
MDNLSRLTTALEGMEDLRRKGGDALNNQQSEVSGWSAAQHLYHVALSTDLAMRCVTTVMAGTSPRLRHDLPKSELFAQLQALGRFPRGTKAPRLVIPPDRVNLEFLKQEIATASTAAQELGGQDLSHATGRIVHEKLGGLDAQEWVTFARMHAEHHLQLAEKILNSASC